MKVGIGLVLVLAASGAASAQSHLLPEESVWALQIPRDFRLDGMGYPFDRESLAPAFDSSVRIFNVEQLGSFPESVVGIKTDGDAYYIFGARPSGRTAKPLERPIPLPPPIKLLGPHGNLHEEPPPVRPFTRPPAEYVLNTCKAQIDGKLAGRVIRAWDSVLLETRPEAGMPRFGADGGISHFGSNMQFGVVTGWAWSPQVPDRPGWLSKAAFDLSNMCWSKGKSGPYGGTDLEEVLTHLE